MTEVTQGDPWAQIEEDDRYKRLDYAGRRKVADLFFKREFESHPDFQPLDDAQRGEVKTAFLKRLGPSPEGFDEAAEVQDPGVEMGPIANFADSFRDGLVSQFADFQNLGGFFAAADETTSNVEESPFGANARTAGSIASGVAPTALALGTIAATGGAATPVVIPALLGFYALTSGGAARRYVHEFRKANPEEEISGEQEALLTLGAGAIGMGFEALGVTKALGPILKAVSAESLKVIGLEVMQGSSTSAAKRIAQVVLGEGAEEAAQEGAQNLLRNVLVNPEQAIGEGVLEAGIAGAFGGALLTPLGGKRFFQNDAPVYEDGGKDPLERDTRFSFEVASLASEKARILREAGDDVGASAVLEEYKRNRQTSKFYKAVAGLNPDGIDENSVDRASVLNDGEQPYVSAEDFLQMDNFQRVQLATQKVNEVPETLLNTLEVVNRETNTGMDLALDAYNASMVKASKIKKNAQAIALADEAYTELLSQWNALNPGDAAGTGFQAYLNERLTDTNARKRQLQTFGKRGAAKQLASRRTALATAERSALKGRIADRVGKRVLVTGKKSIADMTGKEITAYDKYLKQQDKAKEQPAVEEKGLIAGSITAENVVETEAEVKPKKEKPRKPVAKVDPEIVEDAADGELAELEALAAELDMIVDEIRMSDFTSDRSSEIDDDDLDIDGDIDEANIVYQDAHGKSAPVLLSGGFTIAADTESRGFDEPTILQRQRLTNTLVKNGFFRRVHWVDGQIIGPDGKPKTAATDLETGDVWFSSQIRFDTIGHEAAHRLIEVLGRNDPIVEEGLFLAEGFTDSDGTELPAIETLSDWLGEFYAGRKLENNVLRRLVNWIRDLWVQAKTRFGRDVTVEQVMVALNARLHKKMDAFQELSFLDEQQARKQSYHGAKVVFQSVPPGGFDYKNKADLVRPTTLDLSTQELTAALEHHISNIVRVPVEGEITNDELKIRATRLLTDPKKLAKAETDFNDRGTASLESLLALRIVGNLRLRKLWKARATATSEGDEVKAAGYQSDMDKVVAGLENIGSFAGRTFQQQNIVAGPSAVIQAVEALERDLTPAQHEALKDLFDSGKIDDPVASQEFVDRLELPPRMQDFVWELYMANPLSSPTTHAVNFLNNGLWLGAQMPERLVMSAIDASLSSSVLATIFPSLRGRKRTIYANEVRALWLGAKEGRKIGKIKRKEFLQKVKKGESTAEITSKFFRDYGRANRAWSKATDRFGDTPFARGMERAAPYITFSPDRLAAVDIYFKEIGASAQLRALAERRFREQGVPVKATLANPPIEMLQQAAEFGDMVTFSNRAGVFTTSILGLREKLPFGVGKAVIPFVTTLSNIFKRGMEFTPGAPLLTNAGRESLRADLTVPARQLEGAMMLLLFSAMFDEDEITTGIPDNPTDRGNFFNNGKIPWAIKMPDHLPGIGGTWVSYQKMEPFNTALAVFATLREALSKSDEVESNAELFALAANNIAENMIESTYTDGIARTFFPGGRFDPALGIERTAEQIPSNFVPYSSFWRNLNRAFEAENREPDGAPLREKTTILAHLAETIPGNALIWDVVDQGSTKVNALGEEIIFPGGLFRQWLPLRYSTPDLDPVEQGLAELGWMPGLPSRRFLVSGQEVKVEDEEYWTYATAYGAAVKKQITPYLTSSTFRRQISSEAGKVRAAKRVEKLTRKAQRRLRRRMQRQLQVQSREAAASR